MTQPSRPLICVNAGLAVVCDMLLTTSFLTLIMICVWRKNLILPIIFFTIFFFIETTFLSASTLKVSLLPSMPMSGVCAFHWCQLPMTAANLRLISVCRLHHRVPFHHEGFVNAHDQAILPKLKISPRHKSCILYLHYHQPHNSAV